MKTKLSIVIILVLLIILLHSSLGTLQENKSLVPVVAPAQGNALYFSGNLPDAIAFYEQLLLDYAPNQQIVLSLAYLYLESGQPQSAIDALYTYPKEPNLEMLTLYGTALRANNQAEQAIKPLVQAKEINDQWNINWQLALTYKALGENDKAILHFANAIKLGPPSPLILNDYAYTLAEMGNIHTAIETMEQSIRFDTSQYYLYWQLGEWAAEIEDFAKAIGYLQSAQRVRSVPEIQRQINLYQEHIPKPDTPKEPVAPQPPTLVTHRPVVSVSDATLIRIGLIERVSTATLSAGTSFELIHNDNVVATGSGNTLWELSLDPKKRNKLRLRNPIKPDITVSLPVRLRLIEPNTTFALYDMAYGEGYFWVGRETRQFRGELELLQFPAGLTIVNELPLEEYLYSVVPGEMIASWPMEALKAQAVAARTYTAFHLGRYSARGFDLLSSVFSAHYPGVTREHQRTTDAVIATRNQIITHNNLAIDAVYSANNGGIRSSSAEIWGGHRDYLLHGDDGAELPLTSPAIFNQWLREDSDAYSNIGIQRSNFRWTRTYSIQDLQRFAPTQIGQVLDLRVTERGESGRVTTIEWVGSNGRTSVSRDSIRGSLGGLRSNLFVMFPTYNALDMLTGVTLWGAGWGHGVGMSQAGARGMATSGYSYLDILKHYYPNTKIETTKDI